MRPQIRHLYFFLTVSTGNDAVFALTASAAAFSSSTVTSFQRSSSANTVSTSIFSAVVVVAIAVVVVVVVGDCGFCFAFRLRGTIGGSVDLLMTIDTSKSLWVFLLCIAMSLLTTPSKSQ